MTTETMEQTNLNGNEAPNTQNNINLDNDLNNQPGQPRVISNPGDVANLVLMQVDAVNAKKDELTIAMKQLTDTTKQLVRAYGEHTSSIIAFKKEIEELKS